MPSEKVINENFEKLSGDMQALLRLVSLGSAARNTVRGTSSARTIANAVSALLRASRVAQARGSSPFFGVSSTSAGRSASGSMPA